jgi:predicted phage baseplate assembly protein
LLRTPESVLNLNTADDIQVKMASSVTLTLPLRLLWNLLDITEGKTVANEVLGDGDPTAPGQTFVLQKSPLTYLAGSDPSFPTSTLTVRVDSLTWAEVKSFYGQALDAQVFVTREDADHKTHVMFGDGVRGARLPRGTGNVTAAYRFGSGGPAPAAGSIVTILKPVPNLASVKNPVQVSGGADPTPATKIRRYAPRSVLTFGRAVSAADYEAIAANAPSVTRARAYYSWDPLRQRATVVVYVGDNDGAKDEARQAIDSARDPNFPATVTLAKPIHLDLTATLAYDARFDPDLVGPQVVSALVGDGGLFSPDRIRIGEPLYDSQIYAACLGVTGTVAVRNLVLADVGAPAPLLGVRHAPGEGGFFTATAPDIHLTLEAQ